MDLKLAKKWAGAASIPFQVATIILLIFKNLYNYAAKSANQFNSFTRKLSNIIRGLVDCAVGVKI